jgi:EmrB/QacA subfamily drug resistance transporter
VVSTDAELTPGLVEPEPAGEELATDAPRPLDAPTAGEGQSASVPPIAGSPVPVSPAPAEGEPDPQANPWGTLFVVALGVVMVGLDATVVSIANPAIASSLHASLGSLQWITNAYLLALAVLLIPGGKLGDRFGRKRIFLVGVAGFTVSSAGVAVIGSVAGVIAMRGLQGAFGALLLPNTIALIRAAFPLEELNRAVGIWSASSAAAIAGAPVIGGLLVEKVSWQSVFFLNVPIGIATIVCGIKVMPESRESQRQRFDLVGLGFLASSVFCLVFGVIHSETWGWTSTGVLALLGASGILGAAFVMVESRAEAPLVPLPMLTERSISIGVVTLLLNFFALYGVLFFVSLYLQNIQNLDAVQAGIRLLPLIGVFSATSPFAGRVTTRYGARVPITLGMGLTTVSLLGMLDLSETTSFWLLCPSLAGIGLGVALVVVASTEAIIASAPVDDAGVAGGLQGISIQLGGVLGASILGSILAGQVTRVLPGLLSEQGVPPRVAAGVTARSDLVSQGRVPDVAGPRWQSAVTTASHQAFLSGLRLALLVGAAACFVGTICGLFVTARPVEMEIPRPVHF